MASFTALNALAAFDMFDSANVESTGPEITNTTSYGFDTSNLVDIDISGAGFTYDGDGNIATATSVSQIDIDVDGDQPGAIGSGDILISGLPTALATNIQLVDDSANRFWDNILAGDDAFDLTGFDGISGQSAFFGDDYKAPRFSVLSFGTTQGGDDTFTLADHEMIVVGDVYTVAGRPPSAILTAQYARYAGGNDTIVAGESSEKLTLIGDAYSVDSYSSFTGGDDVIDASANSAFDSFVVGDVLTQTAGAVSGGDDTIYTDGVGSPEGTGDVGTFEGGTFFGGNDTIWVLQNDAVNASTISGDIQTTTGGATGSITAGNDLLIMGSDGAGRLSGDVDLHGNAVLVTAGDDTLIGGQGNDDLFGETRSGSLANFTGGNDLLFGGGGDDDLYGQTGNDTLDGGLGSDFLNGGEGEDWVTFASEAGSVEASLASGSATSGSGNDSMLNIENMLGSYFDDTLTGNTSDNKLDGGLGADSLDGGAGADDLLGGFGNDTLLGGADVDILNGGSGNDRLQGGAGADVLNGGIGLDLADYTDVSYGVTVSLRTSGSQSTGRGSDQLISIERLETGDGDDALKGSDLSNVIGANGGADTVNGFDGDDLIGGGDGDDLIYGAAGDDTVLGENDNDLLRGNGGEDALVGGDGQDTLYGGDDTDLLMGQSGDDALLGEAGADTLSGGGGDDTLRGGGGADEFLFEPGAEVDRIRDWQDGTDMINLFQFGFASAVDALSNFYQAGANVRFTQGSDTLVIEGEVLANITGADLILL